MLPLPLNKNKYIFPSFVGFFFFFIGSRISERKSSLTSAVAGGPTVILCSRVSKPQHQHLLLGIKGSSLIAARWQQLFSGLSASTHTHTHILQPSRVCTCVCRYGSPAEKTEIRRRCNRPSSRVDLRYLVLAFVWSLKLTYLIP